MSFLNRLTTTVMSDLSATLSILMLVFFVLFSMAYTLHPPSKEGASQDPMDVARDMVGVTRAVLSPQELTERFYRRTQITAQGGFVPTKPDRVTIDVLKDGLVLASTKGSTLSLSGANLGGGLGPVRDFFQTIPPEAQIVLFILDPSLYGPVAQVLGEMGRRFEDLSVPQALKARDRGLSAGRWSPEFEDLIGIPMGLDQFRDRLLTLLEGQDLPSRPSGQGEAFSITSSLLKAPWQGISAGGGGIFSGFFEILKTMWALCILAFGAGVVWRQERRLLSS